MTKDEFLGRKWGIFIHYLDALQNNPNSVQSMGKSTSWDECVNELNAEILADQLSEIGAGYLIFTVMQGTRHMIAPNSAFDKLTGLPPGEGCATRDLIEDLYTALTKRNICLFLYFTGDGPIRDPEIAVKLGAGIPVSEQFVRNWADILEEYVIRYGDKVKGWWLDGMYGEIGYKKDHLIKIICNTIKNNNREALISNNYYGCFKSGTSALKDLEGIGDVIFADFYQSIAPATPYCDFTAGEVVDFNAFPQSRFIDGAQAHVLSFLGIPDRTVKVYEGWGRPGSKYTGEYMARYVRQVNDLQGVVSIDVCMYRDGHIDATQLEVLKDIK
ncbi:MAG: hypothetical protein FWD23_00035 [Oscillospiraceae bacterium]|nr:hypothetical protein [Oscillospiraceae bacterium]